MRSEAIGHASPGLARRPVARRRPATRTLVRAAALVTLALAVAAFSFAAPGFATATNLANVVEQSTVLALLAFGMTIVVIAGGPDVVRGGIDLSLAANLGLCNAVYASLSNAGTGDIVASGLAVGVGGLVGMVNAAAVTGFGVLPLLATLATMNVCTGAELVITQNTVLTTSSPLLGFITSTSALGLSLTDWILVAATAMLLFVMHATPVGLRLRAVGGHHRAARAAGLPVRAIGAGAYVAAGLLAGLAAIVQAARLSGSSPGSGDILLSVVLTSLLGVVFSRRLQPSIGGTLVAVLFIGCLVNGFQLVNVSSYWVNGIEGALILSVVALRSAVQRGGRRPAAEAA
ncbi:ABC transporter permease [Lichenicoccus sp.]|uniref:ABC transporter permease n=1 Tax=Lichenicoccus sp. TaxID=2781899 RepID=UPI003D14FDF7